MEDAKPDGQDSSAHLAGVELQVRRLKRIVLLLVCALVVALTALFVPGVRLAVSVTVWIGVITIGVLGFIGGVMALLSAVERRGEARRAEIEAHSPRQ